MNNNKVIHVIALLLVIMLGSCKPTITLDKMNPLGCGSLCPGERAVNKKSILPILGLENLPFILTEPTPKYYWLFDRTQYFQSFQLSSTMPAFNHFGFIDLSVYEDTNFAPNGTLTFTDNNDQEDQFKWAYADFRNLELDPVKFQNNNLNFSKNLNGIMSRLKVINMPPRKSVRDEQSLGGQSALLPSMVGASSMVNPKTGEVIKINGTPFSERLVEDLFDTNSKFYFSGGSSEYQRDGNRSFISNFGLMDGVEFRRSLDTNPSINLKNISSDTITSTNSRGDITGTFVNMDYFQLGNSQGFYLNGEDPSVSTLNNKIFYNLVIDNYRDNTDPLNIHIGQNSQVRASSMSRDYQTFLSNPRWTSNVSFNSMKVFYPFQSLLKEGIPSIQQVDAEKNLRWDNYGNPKIDILLNDHKNDCSPNNNQFEVEVTRGKGNKTITDKFCGIRKYLVDIDYGQVLDLKVSTQSDNPATYYIFSFRNNSGSTRAGKLKIYVPRESKAVTRDFINFSIFDGMDCGSKVVNHKMSSWLNAPNKTPWGKKCILEDSNVVAVDATNSDVPRRYYDGFKKVIIYDSIANKGNWKFNCQMDLADHTFVSLKHYDSNGQYHEMQFFEGTNLGSDGKSNGLCGLQLREKFSHLPTYSAIDAGHDLIGPQCDVDSVMSGGPANCASDDVDTSYFRAEYVDTSNPANSNNTLHGYIGVPE